MSRILSWWSKTTHLSVRSSFLPDLNLTRDNDVQEKVFPRLGLGSMLRPYSHLAQTQPLSSQPNISIKSRPRPSSSEPSPAQSCYSRPLIELAFTLRLHCWNLFRIYDKDSLPGHGRGHMGLAVRFAGIFGNNVWPHLTWAAWLDHQGPRIYCLLRIGLANFPAACHLSLAASP